MFDFDGIMIPFANVNYCVREHSWPQGTQLRLYFKTGNSDIVLKSGAMERFEREFRAWSQTCTSQSPATT